MPTLENGQGNQNRGSKVLSGMDVPMEGRHFVRYHRALPVLMALALFLCTGTAAFAKETPAKVTVADPGIAKPIDITTPATLQVLGLNRLEDFGSPAGAPTGASPGYDLTRYVRSDTGLRPFDRVRYVPDPAGGRGYVYYAGVVGGSSSTDGLWFRASAEGERALRAALTAHGARLSSEAISPQPTPSPLNRNPGVVIWLLPLAAVAALGGGLALQRQRASDETTAEGSSR